MRRQPCARHPRALVQPLFPLPFDASAAAQAATLAAERKQRGRPVDMRDTFIAGIALARRASIATRNTRHFDDLTVPLLNPWAPT